MDSAVPEDALAHDASVALVLDAPGDARSDPPSDAGPPEGSDAALDGGERADSGVDAGAPSCSDLDVSGFAAPVYSAEAAIEITGGTIEPGTYVARAYWREPPFATPSRAIVFRFSTPDRFEYVIRQDESSEARVAGTYSTSGTTITMHGTCFRFGDDPLFEPYTFEPATMEHPARFTIKITSTSDPVDWIRFERVE